MRAVSAGEAADDLPGGVQPVIEITDPREAELGRCVQTRGGVQGVFNSQDVEHPETVILQVFGRFEIEGDAIVIATGQGLDEARHQTAWRLPTCNVRGPFPCAGICLISCRVQYLRLSVGHREASEAHRKDCEKGSKGHECAPCLERAEGGSQKDDGDEGNQWDRDSDHGDIAVALSVRETAD